MRNKVPPSRSIRSISIPGAPLHFPPNQSCRQDGAPARPPGTRRATRAFEEIEPAWLRLDRCLGAYPADDLFRIRQEGENGWQAELRYGSRVGLRAVRSS